MHVVFPQQVTTSHLIEGEQNEEGRTSICRSHSVNFCNVNRFVGRRGKPGPNVLTRLLP
jgi:hypothetical protein